MSDPNLYWDEWALCADVIARACVTMAALLVTGAGLLYPVALAAGFVL
ncbi:MAG TPA: hypothetical protein VJ957_08515 [Longimicrobiales bacterium]|nr:hypothetical protein [Longimicrobiales bacterium]